MRDVRLRRSLVTRPSEREVINCPRRYFYLARDPFVGGGLRIPWSELSFYSRSQIGKCIACLRSRRSDVTPSQSATLCARKSHSETIVDRETYTVAQSPTERFGFSIFSPRRPPSPRSLCPRVPYSSSCDFPRSSAHLRSQELVRPQRNGRSVAFWTRACSQEDREEKFTSLHLVHFTLLFFDWFKFSDFAPFRCPCNHLCLCASAERAPALYQRSFMPFRSGRLIHD